MPIALAISLAGHVTLILVMAVGFPSWLEPERHSITAESVGVVTEAQLAALSKPQLPPGRDAAEAKPETAADRAAAEAAQTDAASADQAGAASADQANAADAAQADAAVAENQPPPAAADVGADAARNIADVPAAEALSAPNQLATAPPATAPQPVPPIRAPDVSTAPPPPIPDAAVADAPPPPEAPAPEAPPVETAAAPPPPTPQPETPEAPPPRDVIAQTPPAPRQPQARSAVVPPRRPPNLDPPDEQLASLPPETARKPAPKKDFLSLMQGAIADKPSDNNLASVAESLGVGVSGGRLSSADQKAISSRLGGCWRPIAGARNAKELAVTLAVEFSRTSEVVNIQVVQRPPASAGRFAQVAVDRAKQAVQQCSPLNKFGQLALPQDKYSDWSRMRIRFDPSELAG